MEFPPEARSFEEVLSSLEALLRKYGHDFHADYMASMRDLWPSDKATFRYRACDRILWGGNGSVFDIHFEAAAISKSEVDRDRYEFHEALAELVRAMRHEGFGTSLAYEVESIIGLRHQHGRT